MTQRSYLEKNDASSSSGVGDAGDDPRYTSDRPPIRHMDTQHSLLHSTMNNIELMAIISPTLDCESKGRINPFYVLKLFLGLLLG